jgi:hypothetical protein
MSRRKLEDVIAKYEDADAEAKKPKRLKKFRFAASSIVFAQCLFVFHAANRLKKAMTLKRRWMKRRTLQRRPLRTSI